MKARLLSLLLLAACGGSSHKPATEPPKPATLGPVAWKDMDLKQREQFMKDVVLPKSKQMFVAFDAKKYESMDCKTCHGAGAEDGSFDMPNPKIKPLPNTEEAFIAWVSKDPDAGRYAKFMSEQVEPGVAQMIGAKPFDPQTKTGEFGCSNCHELVDADGKIVPHEKHDHDHDHK